MSIKPYKLVPGVHSFAEVTIVSHTAANLHVEVLLELLAVTVKAISVSGTRKVITVYYQS